MTWIPSRPARRSRDPTQAITSAVVTRHTLCKSWESGIRDKKLRTLGGMHVAWVENCCAYGGCIAHPTKDSISENELHRGPLIGSSSPVPLDVFPSAHLDICLMQLGTDLAAAFDEEPTRTRKGGAYVREGARPNDHA